MTWVAWAVRRKLPPQWPTWQARLRTMSVARFFGWTAARFVRSINPRETVMPRVWLITGASRGLGWALADAVVAAGHMLIATARNPSHLADLEQRASDRVRAVSLNVTDAAAAERAFKPLLTRSVGSTCS